MSKIKDGVLTQTTQDMRSVVKEMEEKYYGQEKEKINSTDLRLDIITNLVKALKEFVQSLWNTTIEKQELENLIMQFVCAFGLGTEHRFDYDYVPKNNSVIDTGCVVPLAQYLVMPLVEIGRNPKNKNEQKVVFVFMMYRK